MTKKKHYLLKVYERCLRRQRQAIGKGTGKEEVETRERMFGKNIYKSQ